MSLTTVLVELVSHNVDDNLPWISDRSIGLKAWVPCEIILSLKC